MNINRRIIFIVSVFIVFVISLFTYVSYLNSQQYVTLVFSNVSKITLDKIGSQNGASSVGVVVRGSDKKIKISKGDYLLNYSANNGFASDSFTLPVGDTPVTKTINPDYSTEKYSSVLSQEKPTIDSVLFSKYPNLASLYDIQTGKLYEKGNWYATTLLYKGDDYFNYDTLRVVMEKENNQWVIKTDPPDINLDSLTYPNIPIEILKDVNNTQIPQVSDRFKTSQ